jgi:hypothetical protein
MAHLFEKAAVMGDIHFGNKSNSIIHNQDCINFIHWFVEEAKKNNCETCIFMGDYFHNRNNTNLITMNYGLDGMRILSESFKKTYVLLGNHDLFYRDQRSVSSIAWAEHIPNIEIIKEITEKDNVVFVPWLIQNESEHLFKKNGMYMFGHFELPTFMMNSMVEMPDVGEFKIDEFKKYEHVFSGHFHLRQNKKNITYIGNAFPHNYGDAGDDNRGMMILEWGKEPEYLSWPDAPKYRTVKISDLVIDPQHYLPNNGYIKLILDADVSYEETSYLKENLLAEFNLREISLVSLKKDININEYDFDTNVKFQTVSTIVENQLVNIESEFYDSKLLLDIYKGL